MSAEKRAGLEVFMRSLGFRSFAEVAHRGRERLRGLLLPTSPSLGLRIVGHLTMGQRFPDGTYVGVVDEHNVIVDNGLTAIAHALAGSGDLTQNFTAEDYAVTAFALGTGGVADDRSLTAMQDSGFKKSGDQNFPRPTVTFGSGQVIFQATVGDIGSFTGGNALDEAGLLAENATAPTTGAPLAGPLVSYKAGFTVEKDDTFDLELRWTYTLTNP